MTGNGIMEPCDNHPLMGAVAECSVCCKPVCGDCAVSKNGKYFCDDSSHPTLFENYTILCEAKNIFAMELIARNLEANGVLNQWFDRQRYHKGSLPVLFVLNGEVEKAHSVIHSLDLADFISLENNAH